MLTKIQKWGNSQGLRIPSSFLKTLNLQVNEKVRCNLVDDKIIIEKVIPKKKSLKKLFEEYEALEDNRYETKEIEWGMPEGKEVW